MNVEIFVLVMFVPLILLVCLVIYNTITMGANTESDMCIEDDDSMTGYKSPSFFGGCDE